MIRHEETLLRSMTVCKTLKKELRTNPKIFGKPSNSSGRPSALVVDDNQTNRLVLNAMLAELGYDVIEAKDGVQAIACFMKARPDIILMDIAMPGMDGYEATRRIRSLDHHNLLPIIFVTAYTDEQALDRCFDMGGDDVLVKPFSLTLLKFKIRAIERMHNLSRERDVLSQTIKQDEVIAEKVFNEVVFGWVSK